MNINTNMFFLIIIFIYFVLYICEAMSMERHHLHKRMQFSNVLKNVVVSSS
jgi:flagellar biogenesis protein FliO